jgi:hypothetical protein
VIVEGKHGESTLKRLSAILAARGSGGVGLDLRLSTLKSDYPFRRQPTRKLPRSEVLGMPLRESQEIVVITKQVVEAVLQFARCYAG